MSSARREPSNQEALAYPAGRGIRLAVENFWRGPGCHAADIRAVLDALPTARSAESGFCSAYPLEGPHPRVNRRNDRFALCFFHNSRISVQTR